MPTPSLLQRLKERKLVQWAIAYLCGAWVLVEATNLVVERFHWPEVIGQAIIIIAFFGFLLALVLAWYHGEKGRQRVSGPELLMVAAMLVVAGGVLWGLKRDRDTPSTPSALPTGEAEDERPSIAVLPFQNFSPNPDDAYFADGMQEQLVSTLSQIGGLSVRGRTSVMRYRGDPKPLPLIAEEIGVTFILEGSARMAIDQVVVTAQLIDARRDEHLWSEEYDREFSVREMVSVQRDIAQEVVEAIGTVLTPEEEVRVAAVPTESPEAYDFYLRGRYFWNQRTLAAFDSAIDYYGRAILLDPNYARAYAALAETYVLLPEFGGPAIPEILPLAKAATERALSLDPGIAEAYAASGYLKAVFEWERDASEQDLLRAIELNPNCATAHYWYAELLGVTRRWDEALREARRALELDPLSSAAHSYVGLLLMDSGRPEEAIPVFERTLEITPFFYNTVYLLATAYTLEGDYTAAAPLYDRLAELTGTDREAYRAFLAALSDPAKTPAAVMALQTSNVYSDAGRSDYLAQLGQLDEALAALDQAYEARRPYLPWVNAHPWYEPLRSDPRFQDLLRRMNFPS